MISILSACLSLMSFLPLPTGPAELSAATLTLDAHLVSPGGALRFVIELDPDAGGDGQVQAWLRNGVERVQVPRTEWDGESLVLHITHFDATLSMQRDGDSDELRGEWRQRRGLDKFAVLPAVAREGSRLSRHGEGVTTPIDGRWRVKFSDEADPAVGVFGSHEGKLLGTFLTTTGDYRWLHGEQVGDRVTLSTFDGAHAFHFTAELQPDGSLAGDFYSRDTYHDTFTAVRDADMQLADGFGLTRWEAGANVDELSFPDLDGTPRRLGDEAFAGRARIVQLFGSWCPNCHDASEFLVELEEEYGSRGLSIVGLAFEYTGEHARDAEQVREYARAHGVSWPLLIAGISKKSEAAKALPFLDAVRSYPTTIFVRADGSVQAVYQGFSGPAAGEAHTELKARFRGLVEKMLSEGPGSR